MPVIQKNVAPHKGVQIDLSEIYINELYAVFIKGWTEKGGANDRLTRGEGSNQLVWTPLESNATYCNLPLPKGYNYVCGFYHSPINKKGYVFVYNEFGNHLIYRIQFNGSCQVVYKNRCLDFVLDPEHFIRDGRVHVEVECYFDKVLGHMTERTFIIFTNNNGEIKMICEEDSILTNSFDPELHPMLATTDFCKPCSFIQLGMDTPFYCPTFETIPNSTADDTVQNHTLYKSLQWRYQFQDVWGRWSEWSPISDQYIAAVGGACINESSGLPRCLKISLNAGCPFVEKVRLAFRRCTGNLRGLPTASDWYLYDTIEKYNNYNKVHWWDRGVNPDLVFDNTTGLGWDTNTNTIHYKFCGNKECQPIDVNETNRLQNPIVKSAATLFGLGKGIGVGRGRRGYAQLDPRELAKIDFTVETPTGDSCTLTENRKIKVWGLIYNPYEEVPSRLKKVGNNVVFGIADCAKNNPYAYGQVLPEGQEGIVACLYGTKHYAVSKQYRYDRQTGNLEDVGMNFYRGIFPDPFQTRYVPMQLWEFDVLPGKYIFHICSHQAKPTDDFYWKTSTYFKGRTSLSNIGSLYNGEERELVIGACDSDVEIFDTPAMIYDMTRIGKGCSVVDASSVNAGYLYEDEENKVPIEKARVLPNSLNRNSPTYYSQYTDRNGFYFSTNVGRGLQTHLHGYKNCTPNERLVSSRTSFDNADSWYRFDKLYVYKGDDLYPEGDRYVIRGKVTLCNNPSIGVSGVLVVLTNGQYGITDGSGIFRITAHDNGWTDVARTEKLIFSQRGTCHLLNCATGCSYCFPDISVSSVPCTGNVRTVEVVNQVVNIRGLNKKGPKNGGRYGIGVVRHYRASRMSFVGMMDKHYLDIPGLIDIRQFDFSRLKYFLSADIDFGLDVEKISFWITDNLNWDDDLHWTIERVQYVDATGNTNTSAPTQIRLYYEGLNEYNKQHGLSTTTIWQFINEDKAIEGDQVEFLINGDGTWFTKKIISLVKYDKAGKYIQIDYSDDLQGLKDGLLVHIIRPKQCENKEYFYEIPCSQIKVVNGKPIYSTGYLNYHDSYMLSRQIPVPEEVIKKEKDDQGNDIETSAIENKLRSYPYLYEHHSPSDFWGDHCFGRGRVNVKNPLEKETCNKMEMALSKASSEKSDFNGLSYFDTEDITDFEISDYGGINLVFTEVNTVIAICESDVFVVGYNDNRVRVNAQGEVESISLPNRMGRPQKSDLQKFGCDLRDLNTITRSKDGIVFLDRHRGALIHHDFSKAHDISTDVFRSWLQPKIRDVAAHNQSNRTQRYFHSVVDLSNNEYLLCVSIIGQTESHYINDLPDYSIPDNETVVVDMDTKAFLGQRPYTPELFGSMSDEAEAQLFSFRFGQPWGHYGVSNTYNTFFGQKTNRVMEFVVGSKNKDDVYKFLWMEVYCKEHLFNAPRIFTQSGQLSRLMRSWWERRNQFSTADLKAAVNTPVDPNLVPHTTTNVLLEGDPLYGQWMKVRLVGEASARDKYAELYSVSVFMFTERETSQ